LLLEVLEQVTYHWQRITRLWRLCMAGRCESKPKNENAKERQLPHRTSIYWIMRYVTVFGRGTTGSCLIVIIRVV
jgi:hypothetical protein